MAEGAKSMDATVLTVVGARPQFVKAAVVSKALASCAGIKEIIVHTGQHYDAAMSQVFFDELDIPAPQLNLGAGSGSHGAQTAQILIGLEEAIIRLKPDIVLVYGDTNSTLAAALASAKLNVPLAHVEAGLRSFDRSMPEEINRYITDHLSQLLFAPSDAAVENLAREGIAGPHIVRTGDVMIDASMKFKEISDRRSNICARLGVDKGSYALATVHRASNVDDEIALSVIVQALSELSQTLPVVLPLHPRTRARLRCDFAPGVKVIEPVGYLDMCQLEAHAELVVTDSGGVQKEAFFYGVPCVTLRSQTEWGELVAGGFNRLAPPVNARGIVSACLEALRSIPDFAGASDLLGCGDSAAAIARELAHWISRRHG